MSLGRSAIPLPVLRYSAAASAPSSAALFFLPGHERDLHLADTDPRYLNPAHEAPYAEPSYEDRMLLAEPDPRYLEP